MFGRNSVARSRRGRILSALAATLPTVVWAQWWGPYGHPMGPAPGIAAPPAPPSVSEFMSNPGPDATASRGGMAQTGDCGAPKAAATAYYVIGPGMAVQIVHPPSTAPCPKVTAPGAVGAADRGASSPGTVSEQSETNTKLSDTEAESAATTVAARATASGEILVDGAGMTLYVTGSDQLNESSCYADCARNWPPATAPLDAETAGDLAVITRSDGTRQWTFKGRPLYRWAGDKQPGDTKGNGLANAWAVARPD